MRAISLCLLLPVLWMTAAGLRAADQASPLETFEAGPLQLADGETLASCAVGYRTYGELNAAKDNAILFPTWFSGRSEQLAELLAPTNCWTLRATSSSRLTPWATESVVLPQTTRGVSPHPHRRYGGLAT